MLELLAVIREQVFSVRRAPYFVLAAALQGGDHPADGIFYGLDHLADKSV